MNGCRLHAVRLRSANRNNANNAWNVNPSGNVNNNNANNSDRCSPIVHSRDKKFVQSTKTER